MPAAAVALCVLLGALALFQLALILGAPVGRFAWGGQYRVLPAKLRIGSAVAIVIYALIGALALDRASVIEAAERHGKWLAASPQAPLDENEYPELHLLSDDAIAPPLVQW